MHRTPGILDSTPGKADEEDGCASQEQHRADPVRLSELLSEGELGYCVEPDENQSEHKSQKTEWEVDIETPTPCRVLNEGTSDDRSDDSSYSPSTQDDGEILGAEPQWHDITEDDLAECDDTSTTDTLDASPDEHDCKVIRNSTKYCSDREECEGEYEKLLTAEKLGDGSDDGLEYCTGEEV